MKTIVYQAECQPGESILHLMGALRIAVPVDDEAASVFRELLAACKAAEEIADLYSATDDRWLFLRNNAKQAAHDFERIRRLLKAAIAKAEANERK